MYRNLASIRRPIGTLVKVLKRPETWKVVGLLGKTSNFDCQIESDAVDQHGSRVMIYASANWFDLVAA